MTHLPRLDVRASLQAGKYPIQILNGRQREEQAYVHAKLR